MPTKMRYNLFFLRYENASHTHTHTHTMVIVQYSCVLSNMKDSKISMHIQPYHVNGYSTQAVNPCEEIQVLLYVNDMIVPAHTGYHRVVSLTLSLIQYVPLHRVYLRQCICVGLSLLAKSQSKS